jgi:hypothetical protein
MKKGGLNGPPQGLSSGNEDGSVAKKRRVHTTMSDQKSVGDSGEKIYEEGSGVGDGEGDGESEGGRQNGPLEPLELMKKIDSIIYIFVRAHQPSTWSRIREAYFSSDNIELLPADFDRMYAICPSLYDVQIAETSSHAKSSGGQQAHKEIRILWPNMDGLGKKLTSEFFEHRIHAFR